jgi:hypothetical protein
MDVAKKATRRQSAVKDCMIHLDAGASCADGQRPEAASPDASGRHRSRTDVARENLCRLTLSDVERRRDPTDHGR